MRQEDFQALIALLNSSSISTSASVFQLQLQSALAKEESKRNKRLTLKQLTSLLITACKNNEIEIARVILAADADPNLPGKYNDKYDKIMCTPLYVAAKKGYVNIVQLLLNQHGIQINKGKLGSDDDEEIDATPLYAAAENGYTAVVGKLLAKGAATDGYDEDYSPLYMAVENGHLDIVKLLLTAHANPNVKNVTNYTPLHEAAENDEEDYQEIIKLLLQFKADINAKDCFGNTPLHIAIWFGCQNTAKLLIANGANPNIKNNAGNTPATMVNVPYLNNAIHISYEAIQALAANSSAAAPQQYASSSTLFPPSQNNTPSTQYASPQDVVPPSPTNYKP